MSYHEDACSSSTPCMALICCLLHGPQLSSHAIAGATKRVREAGQERRTEVWRPGLHPHRQLQVHQSPSRLKASAFGLGAPKPGEPIQSAGKRSLQHGWMVLVWLVWVVDHPLRELQCLTLIGCIVCLRTQSLPPFSLAGSYTQSSGPACPFKSRAHTQTAQCWRVIHLALSSGIPGSPPIHVGPRRPVIT